MLCDCSISRCFTLNLTSLCALRNFCTRLSLFFRLSKVYNKLVNLFLYLLTFYSCFSPLRETVFYFSIFSLYVCSRYPALLYFFQLFLILPSPSPLFLSLSLSFVRNKARDRISYVKLHVSIKSAWISDEIQTLVKTSSLSLKVFADSQTICIYQRNYLLHSPLFPHIFQNKFNII